MSTESRLNNAIVKLAWAAGGAPISDGRKASIRALESHWAAFWRSTERTVTPTPVLLPKLKRYVRWYTRAWILLPRATRETVPSPGSIDPTLKEAAADTLRAYLQGAETVAQTPAKAAAWAEGQADRLRKSIDSASSGYSFAFGAALALGLVLYLQRK